MKSALYSTFRLQHRSLVILFTFGWFVLLATSSLVHATSNPLSTVNRSGAREIVSDSEGLIALDSSRIYLPTILKIPHNPNQGSGPIYFVSTTGNDSNPGTYDSPFRTIAKGISVLKTGSTLYLRSGTYIQTAPLKIQMSGASDNPITISTAPGEPSEAIITGDVNGDGKGETPGQSTYNGLVELRGNYINFQDIEIAYSAGRGIASGGSHNFIARNNVHHIWNSGIYVYGPDNIIDSNTVWRTADSNYCNGSTSRQCNGGWPGGVAWGDVHDASEPGVAPRIIIRNNRVFNTSGEGILCMHSDYGLIEGNVVYDNWALNIDLDQCSYTTIQKNLVYFTRDTIWWLGTSRPGPGIMISNEGIKDSAGNTYPIGHDRKVINNIVVGSFYFWSGDGGLTTSALVNDLIANNTFVNPRDIGGSGIKIDTGPHANTRIVNNIIRQTVNPSVADVSTNGITFSNNLWAKMPPSAMYSSTDIIADPLLVDPDHPRSPGAVLAEWYKIRNASPAINGGAILMEVNDDYWGISRNPNPDIGASEYIP